MKNQLLFLITLAFTLTGFAQPLAQREDDLVELMNAVREAKNDVTRAKLNTQFKDKLKETIEVNGSFQYTFSKLKSLGCITSPDNKMKIYNWNIVLSDESNNYYAFIQKYDDKKGNYQVIELKDNSKSIAPKTNEILDNTSWYGALYYKIIPVERNKKTYYTVLGWDGNNPMSNMKVIDVISFTGSQVKFGAPMFRLQKEAFNRIWFEYSKTVTMHLNYEEKYKRIIFDHLAPETPALKGFYSMYIPDLSHDALIFNDGKWYLVEDVIGLNAPIKEKITIYVPNEKTGEIEAKTLKNKWVEPSKLHVAAMPDEDGQKVKTQSSIPKSNEKVKKAKGKKSTPTSYNPTYTKKPKKKR